MHPINSFLFETNCAEKSENYPGLIDAIYICFFHNAYSETDSWDYVLEAMKGIDIGEIGTLTSDITKSHPGYVEKSDDIAQLSFYTTEESELETITNKVLRIPIDYNKSSFSCKSQGQNKGSTYLSELNVVFKERSSKVSELQHALLHTGFKLGVFFRDANGDARLMADPYYDMTIETSDESGEGPTGSSSASIKFSQVSKMPPIYWRGTIMFDVGIRVSRSSNSSWVDLVTGEIRYPNK